jgi:hypothetical protein
MKDTDAPEYLIARVREAMARDERTHALDVCLRLSSGRLSLSGDVDTEERRRLIEQVARETLPPDVEVDNQLKVPELGPPVVENVE